MNLLEQFKEFLFSQKEKPSLLTVKNYLADIRHFITWYELNQKQSFKPELVDIQILNTFKIQSKNKLSLASIERHMSSLRKFFGFLKLEGQVPSSPFEEVIPVNQIKQDPFHLKEFKDFLYVYNASNLTIKNYLIDIKQFLSWVEEVTKPQEAWLVADKNIFTKLTPQIVEEYKNRLITENVFSPSSINRKLSSLRRYLSWAEGQNLLTSITSQQDSLNTGFTNAVTRDLNLPNERLDGFKNQDLILQNENLSTAKSEYSSFPPVRLAQKVSKGIGYIADFILVNPFVFIFEKIDDLNWNANGKPVFAENKESKKSEHAKNYPISNIPKSVFAPLAISTASFPLHKKVWHHIKYTRPNWYKRYHSYAISHYFNFAVLVIFMSILGFAIYQNFFGINQLKKLLAAQPQLPQAPLRILSFQGRLTDSSDNPITSATWLRFIIYSSSSSTGSAELWEEERKVTPDQDGIFNVLMGSDGAGGAAALCNGNSPPTSPATGACGIMPTLFSQYNQLWLGVSVENTTELAPRQQLATVAFASNAETLQGLPPITGSGAGQTNVVLALDSSGNLTIGGSATPTFTASGGKFTLSGNVLSLQTVSGSNSNIQLIPDGSGIIDLQKPLQNTTLNNNINTAAGAVEVDDLFAVLATSSGQSAVTINQNGAGPLISASTSGIAKFTVDNSGNTNIAGTLTLSGNVLSSLLPSPTDTLSLGDASHVWHNLYATNIYENGQLLTGNLWQRNLGVLSPLNITDDLILGSTATSSGAPIFAFLNVAAGTPTASISSNLSLKVPTGGSPANSLNLLNGGTLGIYTASSGQFDAGLSGTPALYIANSGHVGINTTNSTSILNLVSSSSISTPAINLSTSTNLASDNQFITFDNLRANIGYNGNRGFAFFGVSGGKDIEFQTNCATVDCTNADIFVSRNSFVGINTTLTGNGQLVVSQANNSGNGDIFAASNSATTKFVITDSGSIGAFSGANDGNILATLDVRGNSGTLPVASASGSTSFATLVANNDGVGDLFTASSSSNPEFTIQNNGTIVSNHYKTAGGVFYTTNAGIFSQASNASANTVLHGGSTPTFSAVDLANDTTGIVGVAHGGTGANLSASAAIGDLLYADSTTTFARLAAVASGSCLISEGTSTAPQWGSCGLGGGAGYWRLNLGAISPTNDTLDVLIGANSTTSAKFGFINVNNGTPTATISAGTNNPAISIDANGNIQTYKATTLTLGGTKTGNIAIGTDATDRSINIGNATGVNALTFNAGSGNINFYTTSNYITSGGNLVLAGTITANNSNTINGLSINSGALSGITGYTQSSGNFNMSGSSGTFQTGTGNVSINGGLAVDLLPTGNGSINLGGPSNYYKTVYADSFTSPVGNGVSGFWTVTNNTNLYPTNSSDDLLIGGTATNSAAFQVLAQTVTGNPGIGGTATMSGYITFNEANGTNPHINILNGNSLAFETSVGGDAGLSSTTPALYIAGSGNVGIGTTGPHEKLEVIGTAGPAADYGGYADFQDSSANGLTLGYDTGNNWSWLYSRSVGTSARSLAFFTTGVTSPSMVINTSGSVGIGTSIPLTSSGLDIEKNSLGNSVLDINQLGLGDVLTASVSGTTKLVLNNSGNLGIGPNMITAQGILDVASQGPNFPSDLTLQQIQATNWVANPSFENTLGTYQQWTRSATAQLTTLNSTESALFGNKAVRFYNVGPAGTYTVTSSSCVSVYGNTKYTLSAYIYEVSGSTGNYGIDFQTFTNTACSAGQATAGRVNVATTNAWTRATSTITTASNVAGIEVQLITDGTNTASRAYFDAVQLEQSSSATPYLDGSLGPGYVWDPTGSPNATDSSRMTGAAFAYNTLNSASGIGAASRGVYPTLQLDQDGSGDIFTASTSGVTQFTIANNGTIKNSLIPNQDLTYNLGSATLRWNTIYANNIVTPVGGGVVGYWQLNSNVLAPTNIWNDLAVGGTGTASATPFQVFANQYANGSSLNSGNVAAGTATTSGNLSFRGSSTQVDLLNGAAMGYYVSPGGDAGLNTAPALYISGSRNVGIGTNSPLTNLHVTGNEGLYSAGVTSGGSPIGASLYLGDNNFTNSSFYNSAPGLSAVYDSNTGVGGDLAFYVYNSLPNSRLEVMRMTATGSVGIGVTNPGSTLQINGSEAIGYSTSTSSPTNGLAVLGSVGIGTNIPLTSSGLDIEKNGLGDSVLAINQSGLGDVFTASVSGTTKLVLNNTGNLGIGPSMITAQGILDVASQGPSFPSDLTLQQVAATNLVANPSFENTSGTFTKWTQSATAQLQALNSTESALFGSKAARFYNVGPAGTYTVTSTCMSVYGGRTYTLSGYIYEVSGDTGNYGIDFQTFTNTGCSAGQATAGRVNVTATNAWTRITSTQTLASNVAGVEVRFITDGTNTASRAYFDAIQLEQSSSATPYLDGSLGPGYVWDPTGAPNATDSSRMTGAAFAYNALNSASGIGAASRGVYPTLQLDQDGSGDIMTASASGITELQLTNGGTLYTRAFYDLDNTTYFLDPAAGGTSLNIAGDASVSANLTFYGAGITHNVYTYNNGNLDFKMSPGGGTPTTGIKDALYLQAATGNVGIGNTNPVVELANTTSNITDASGLGLAGGGTAGAFGWNSTSAIGWTAAIYNSDAASTANGLLTKITQTDTGSYIAKFESGGTNRLSIRADGNIGIKTTSPAAGLDIETGGSELKFGGGNGNSVFTAGDFSESGAHYLGFTPASNGETFVIDNSGNANSHPLWVYTGNSNGANSYVVIHGNFGTHSTSTLTVGGGCSTGDNGVSCTDYAEFYNSIEIAEPADIISLDEASSSGKMVRVADSAYDPNVIGVVSTNPAIIIQENQLDMGGVSGPGPKVVPSFKPPVALAGRVPVKVSTVNGAIHVGDMITSSNIKAFGMKATQAGNVVGKAMEDFDPANGNVGEGIIDCPDGTPSGIICGETYVFVKSTWWDPDVYLTTTGDIQIAGTYSTSDFSIPHYYTLNDVLGNPISRMGVFLELAVGNLRAGSIQAQQIITNSLAVSTDNISIAGQSLSDYIVGVVQSAIDSGVIQTNNTVSPIAEVNQIHTNVISPLANDSNISVTLNNSQLQIHTNNSSTSAVVAAIDNNGNATFSGQLNSNQLAVIGDATISGTLHANNIEANTISGLAAVVSTLSAQNITNVTNIIFATPSATPASNSSNFIADGSSSSGQQNFTPGSIPYADIASFSSYLAYVPSLHATTGIFDQGLISLGPTSLSDTSIVGQLSINGNLILAQNSVNVLGANFDIQPLKQGGVSFEGGLIAIDTDGNLTANGKAMFNGTLAANIISPLANDKNVNIQLGQNSSATGSALATSTLNVQNASGSGVFNIDQLGNVIASGAGTFGKLNLEFAQPALALSDTEVVATGSAGQASIKAHETEVTIDNSLVTQNSLIYITPVGTNQTPYLERQLPGASFSVGIPAASPQSIDFNWLIVN